MYRAIAIVVLVFFVSSVLPLPHQPAIAQNGNPIPLQCGDITTGEITPGENSSRANEGHDDYLLQVQAGTIINVTVEPLGTSFNPFLKIRDAANNYILSFNDGTSGEIEAFLDYQVASTAAYTLVILGANPGSARGSISDYWDSPGRYFGAYKLGMGCILLDGTVIEPGDAPAGPVGGNSGSAPAPIFMGYGFPGANPVDFSAGIEIPLAAGAPQTAPIGPDGNTVALYTVEGRADTPQTLTIARVSGNLSIGVTVINKTDNTIVFFGGLPSSNSLSVELTFPTDGTYAIGLYRLDVGSAVGTSGAVQVSIN